jgi:hypothetical protein
MHLISDTLDGMVHYFMQIIFFQTAIPAARIGVERSAGFLHSLIDPKMPGGN